MKVGCEEVLNLQKANAQLTEMVEALKKAVNHNTCEIGRMSAILEVTAKTAEEAMRCIKKKAEPIFTKKEVTPEVFKSIFGDPFDFKKPTCQESRQVEDPEKKLYLDIWGGDLCICYGTGDDIDDEGLWHIDSENGKIYASTIMPELWNEWQENGCKFDPEPVKWKGMYDEKKYSLESFLGNIRLITFQNVIISITERSSFRKIVDKNILTDKAGRAFIV